MVATRSSVRAAPLPTGAAATCTLGLVAVVCASFAVRAAWHVGTLYTLKAGALFAGIAIVALAFLRQHHPFVRFGAANQATTARAALAALVAALIGETPHAGLAVAIVAATLAFIALDGLDGWLARQSRVASAFGARFDMEIDALLILALAILVWSYGKAGGWIVLAGVMRYAFAAAGRALAWMDRPLPPSRRRQAVCVVQVVGLGVAMSPAVAPPASTVVAAIALGALAWSFASDVVWLRRRADGTPTGQLMGATPG